MISEGIKQKLIVLGFIPYADGEGVKMSFFDENGKKYSASICGCEITFCYPNGSTETYLIDTLQSIFEILSEKLPFKKDYFEKEFKRFMKKSC